MLICLRELRNGLVPNTKPQVLSRAHATAAVFRAVNDYMHNRLKSRNVHSEIVFSLNPTNNVGCHF